jgi:hypothetical protein
VSSRSIGGPVVLERQAGEVVEVVTEREPDDANDDPVGSFGKEVENLRQ